MKKKIDTKNCVIYKSGIMADLSEAIHYLEHKGYFSDNPDFSRYSYGELNEVFASYHHEFAFFRIGATNVGTAFRYFIPEAEVAFIKKKEEEKKLRPFKDAEEFFKETGFELGKTIRYRKKDSKDNRECVVILNGYLSDGQILLGAFYYKLEDLFNYYEYYDIYNLIWKPFGVEE